MTTELTLVRTNEEMLEYIHTLNYKIVQNIDVSDEEIARAILYQRDLNQHNMEKKPRASGGASKLKTQLKESIKKLNLEDL